VVESGVEGVGARVGLLPDDQVYELEFHRLQGEAEAEDYVVRAGDPDGAVGLEDAARLLLPWSGMALRYIADGPSKSSSPAGQLLGLNWSNCPATHPISTPRKGSGST
jgi:hypothetical protein